MADEEREVRAAHVAAAIAAIPGENSGEVGTGAGGGDDRPEGEATLRVNRSVDCPEAPAQAHPPALPGDAAARALDDLAADFAHRAEVYEAHPEHDTDRYLDGYSTGMRVAEKIVRAAHATDGAEAGR